MTISGRKKLYEGFAEVANDGVCNYLNQWTFDKPLVITNKTNQRMHNIQKLLYKAIRYFGEHYDDFRHLMPVTERIYKILSFCKDKPYKVGSYRADFLFDLDDNIKLIEITCRYALNGLFVSGFFNLIADKYIADKPQINKTDEYTPFFDHLVDTLGEFEHICILKGNYDNNESKYAVPIFEKAGYKVYVIPYADITNQLHLLKGSTIITELSHEEWSDLPDETIETILSYNMINDLRTVFLIHDKRFFSVLKNDDFLKAALSEKEIEEINQYIVPTFMRNENPDVWNDAKKNKDCWIIKPCNMGRSIDVFAGCETEREEWQDLFSDRRIDHMVLQPYINQRKYKGKIKDVNYEDYAAGTLLLFNDNFFGPGMFRTSSFPISNKTDNRKIAPLVTNDITDFDQYIII